MLRIRFARHGSKNSVLYRIVVTERKRKREGKIKDLIGYWIPKDNYLKLHKEKIGFWKIRGAQPSDAVNRIIKI